MTTSRTGLFAVPALCLTGIVLSACVVDPQQFTRSQGYASGCESGYADGGWTGATPFPRLEEASDEFKAGWDEGYEECLEQQLRDPRFEPGGGEPEF